MDCQNSESDALMITSTFLPATAPPLPPPELSDVPPEARPATTPRTMPISAMTATSDSENFSRVLAMENLSSRRPDERLPARGVSSVPQPRKRFHDAKDCRPVPRRCQEI